YNEPIDANTAQYRTPAVQDSGSIETATESQFPLEANTEVASNVVGVSPKLLSHQPNHAGR
ncbi:MAG: hypothetical protein ACUVR8_05405, partial [Acidobacteriota bacterium]